MHKALPPTQTRSGWRARAVVILGLVASLPVSALGAPQAADLAPRAGSIRGRVVEARTGAALAAALVQLQGTNQRTVSDDLGLFEFASVPAGKQALLVSVVGYGLVLRDVDVPAGSIIEVTVPVAEGASSYVEEVTVVGSPFREGEAGIAAQTVLGSRDLLALRGLVADDPFRAVQTLPGVVTGDDFRAEFTVRGLGPQHLGLSIDGIDSAWLFHTVRGVDDTGSIALINSDVLESASVMAGARPQRLNAHLGAAVDFTTRDGASDRVHARGLLSVTAATTVWEGPLGTGRRGSWIVAARQSYLDWLLRTIDPETPGTFGFTDLLAKATLRPTTRQSLRLLFIGGRSMLHDSDTSPSRNTLNRGASQTLIGNVGWELAPTPSLVVSQQLYHINSSYVNRVPDGRAREEGTDRDLTWRGRLVWTPAPAHRLDVGGQVQVLDVARFDRTFRSSSEVVNVNLAGRTMAAAVWAGTRWIPTPRLVVSPGVRVDRWTLVDASAASPWLLAEWHVSADTRLRGGVAVQRQAPLVEQSVFAAPGVPLVAERAHTIDAGIERRVGDAWRVTLSAYYRAEGDRLLLGAEPLLRQGLVVTPRDPRWRNTMSGAARGAGLVVERRSVNGVTGWIGYSYDRADLSDEITAETFPSDYDQRHTLNAYGIYRRSSRTSLSARLRLGSNFPLPGYYRRVLGDYYLAAERNRVRLPVYGRLDLRADRSFMYRRQRLTLFAEAVNMTARRNVRPTRPSVNTTTGRVQYATQALFPLLPTLGVLLEF